MTRNRTISTLTTAVALVAFGGVATPARAQQISDARIRELIKQAADRASTGDAGAQQPVAAAAGETRPVVRLTLDDAVKFALERNLDIAVQRLNPEINDIAIASISSVYHPSLTSIVGPSNTTLLPSTRPRSARAASCRQNKTMTVNGGVAQQIPWGGGSFTASLSNFRRESTINSNLFNPMYQSNWNFAYVQPLLRNFRIDSTRQQLQVTKLNRDISDVQLRSTITNTLSNVRNAYWDYVFAVQAVEVAQQSLDLASKLVQDNQTRVEIGTMAPIDVVQAQSEQATRRQTLVAAQSTMAHRRAHAEAPDRGGHRRSELDGGDRPGRSSGLPAADDRHRGGRAARARRADRHRDREKDGRGERRHLEAAGGSAEAADRPADVVRSAGPWRHAVHPRRRRRRAADQSDSRRRRRRASARCSTTTFRRWTASS